MRNLQIQKDYSDTIPDQRHCSNVVWLLFAIHTVRRCSVFYRRRVVLQPQRQGDQEIYSTATAAPCSRAESEGVIWVRFNFLTAMKFLFELTTYDMILLYSMPSTHSASIGYIATSTVLACIKLPIHESLWLESLWRTVPLLVVPPWSIMIMMSRVWLGHHTWPQVFAGACYGIVMAWMWYTMWTNGLNSIGEGVEEMVLEWLKSR